jgi:uncharacterized membrane protein
MNIQFNSHPSVIDPNKLYEQGRSFGTGKVANKIGSSLGSMRTFWMLISLQIAWMTLASFDIGPWRHDKYPFSFLLFISNIFQLLALPVLGYISNQSDKRRAAKQESDHAALTHIAHTADANHQLHKRIAEHLGIDDRDDLDIPEEDRALQRERFANIGSDIGRQLEAMDRRNRIEI